MKEVIALNLKFIGTTGSVPDISEDSPCFLVNDKYLFDCGFNVTEGLRETNCNIPDIRYIIFTHMHHDHYIGLAGLLFYIVHAKNYVKDHNITLGDITVIGPEKDVERVVKLALNFLQYDENSVKVIPVAKGDKFETEDMVIECDASLHGVDARAYKITDKKDGSTLAISGDTLYNKDIPPFYKGANALIHDGTLGAYKGQGGYGHSTIYEAIKTAEDAEIPMLFPMHMSCKNAAEACIEAQPSTNIKLIPPVKGTVYKI